MIQPVIVAGLSGARLTRAWLHEKVGEPFREPIEKWAEVNFELHGEPGAADVVVTDSATVVTVKEYVHELVTCPFCIGFWFTFASAVLLRWTWSRPLVYGLAGAALQSVIVEHYPQFDPEDDGDD